MSAQTPGEDARRGRFYYQGGELVQDHRRRSRGLLLAPKPTVCEGCLTDTEVGVCPADCPTGGGSRQREN